MRGKSRGRSNPSLYLKKPERYNCIVELKGRLVGGQEPEMLFLRQERSSRDLKREKERYPKGRRDHTVIFQSSLNLPARTRLRRGGQKQQVGNS